MEQKRNKFSNWLRNSITARMLVVGLLLLVLLIPLQFVKELIQERALRQQEVINETNDKWGNEVVFSGPIIKIPYKTIKEETVFNKVNKTYSKLVTEPVKYAYFFPEKLHIDTKVQSKELNRSIYESVVFTADMNISGNFPLIDFSGSDIPSEKILWEKATLLIKTSNLKGIRNTLEIGLDSEKLQMTPQYDKEYLNTIQSTPITTFKDINTKPIPFSFTITINGSDHLHFIPIGKETTAIMNSDWHSPSFNGRFLPEDGSRDINADGFSASWKVLQINRQFEQSFFGYLPDLSEFAFGTKLIIPVDEYQKSERTAKYGFMVIGLTLLVFLLIQLVSKIHIHPFQYVMIGLALVMFYTLLISISEHSSFFKSYAIAGASVLALITIYSRAILKGFKFPLLVCTSLASLYGFIYVIIQLESYALLVGSIGLFAILAIVMFASRKIDWGNES
ncbi:cell envelope integrity protein CreD [Constantimarinum furrinae]|uniref:Inner membrane protein CreD n=1 Tax=Constantimarinum furrinae TaxID=2562285 RepID=A0A7G8PV44_9FLAO|nr:cell envelope integrity protein CreD [Constantimarinum furrinae]QNJ98210.1 Inner membrane protein CreD [Constantimarinum furrinae]